MGIANYAVRANSGRKTSPSFIFTSRVISFPPGILFHRFDAAHSFIPAYAFMLYLQAFFGLVYSD